MISIKKATGLSFLLMVSALAAADAFAADVTAEVKALHAADQTWVKAYNAGDADTAANLYDENAILMPPGAPSAHGRAAIRTFLASDMASSAKAGVTFSLGAKPDGGVSDDMGWASGTYAVTDKSGKVIDTGKYLSVSKKVSGKWLYVRDTYNSDGPR
jgi:ketosteroid isomerase-like protein